MKKKMQAGGVVKSQPKRVGPVDPDGAWTKVQERNLPPVNAKTKVSLAPDKASLVLRSNIDSCLSKQRCSTYIIK
jgi:hypothetical protein